MNYPERTLPPLEEPITPNQPSSRQPPRDLRDTLPGRLFRTLRGFAVRHRSPVVLAIYGGVAVVAYALAYVVRFDLTWPGGWTGTFALSVPVLVMVRLLTTRAFRLTMGRWRFVGTGDVVRLVAASTTGTVLFLVVATLLPFQPIVPRSVILMEWVFTTYLTASFWIGYRLLFELHRHRLSGVNGSAKRVLVIGSGEAGNLLAREMKRFPTGYRLIGFVDDDPGKQGTSLHGVRVMGTTSELPLLAERERPDEIIIAVPSATPSKLRHIVDRCQAVDVPFKVLPGIAEVLEGGTAVPHLRELRIEDLLGREPVKLHLPQLAEDLRGKVALISGAAGSIGSELARQVAAHRPTTIILYDQAESDLYFVELELRDRYPDLEVVPVVGDILDRDRLEEVFRLHRPQRVYHAAAYKHVPLMESNPKEGTKNNVVGTMRVARAAGEFGAEKFVLISTDKAVDPVSIMGATKRVAELIILACQDRFPSCSYVAVRFGNVLGSNGSVIPLFQRQITRGGPLTITHPEVTRYFMTTSEAVQLVLQASILKEARGRIAMLEMGEPIKILDLAHNLVRLSGMRVGVDVQIVFTGLRPGEKLHEELASPSEMTLPTAVEKVRIIDGVGLGDSSDAFIHRIESMEDHLSGLTEDQVREELYMLLLEDDITAVERAPASIYTSARKD